MKKILIILGTRPEAIKFAPLIKEIQSSEELTPVVCSTGQHKEMLEQVFNFFSIKADFDLELMTKNQSLIDLSSIAMKKLDTVIQNVKPDLIFVQGDTTTAFIGALAGYYNKIKVAHLEAGLRSFDLYSPFPEEGNRKLIGSIAYYHFTPTKTASKNLQNEGIKKNVFEVGNTVIDALLSTLEILHNSEHNNQLEQKYSNSISDGKTILITAHRRESFGAPFEELCEAIEELANEYQDYSFIFPVHLNPIVQEIVHRKLVGIKNIHLIPPLDYAELIWIMSKSYLIITDSGGIQEEAPTLGKPLIVVRDVTERTEGIEAGTGILTGTNKSKIKHAFNLLTQNQETYNKMSSTQNPYGDGTSSKQIVKKLTEL